MEPNPSNPSASELFKGALEIDQDALDTLSQGRGNELDLSDDLKLLARRNDLEVSKTTASRRRVPGGGWVSETGLRLAGAADAACRFVWASLLIDLQYSPGATVQAITPEREGSQPVEFTDKISPSVEAGIPGTAVKVSLGGEREMKYTVVFPEVIGTKFSNRVIWNFRAPSEEHELRLDHPLHLSVDFPASLDALRAGLTVRAHVAFRGFRGIIPLIGRRTAEGKNLFRLDE